MDIDYSKIKGKKVLLYSGGMDSWLINKLWKPDVLLYVNLHGRYNKQEIAHLPEGTIIEDFDLSKWEREDKILPLRNLYLCMLASNYGDVICLGSTNGDRVLDKSLSFADKSSDILTFLYSPQWWIPEGRQVEVVLPYKNKTKTEILQEYLNNGGDLETAWKESFSCYEPDEAGNVCYKCKPCFRKCSAFFSVGFRNFPKEAKQILFDYIGKEIMPDILNGTYGRGEKEEEVIKEFYDWLRENYEK